MKARWNLFISIYILINVSVFKQEQIHTGGINGLNNRKGVFYQITENSELSLFILFFIFDFADAHSYIQSATEIQILLWTT